MNTGPHCYGLEEAERWCLSLKFGHTSTSAEFFHPGQQHRWSAGSSAGYACVGFRTASQLILLLDYPG